MITDACAARKVQIYLHNYKQTLSILSNFSILASPNARGQAPVNSNHPGPGDKQHISESVIQSIFGRAA